MSATLPTLPTEIQTLILDLLLQNTPIHSPKFQERLVISRRVFDLHVGRLYEGIVLHEGNAKRFIAALDVRCAEGDLLQVASSPTPVPYSQYPSSASRKWALLRTTKRLTIMDWQALRIVGRCADLYRSATSAAVVGDMPGRRVVDVVPAESSIPFPAVEWLVFTGLEAEDESRLKLARSLFEETQSLSRVGFINPHVCVDVASKGKSFSMIKYQFHLFSYFFDSCRYKSLTVHNSHASLPVTQGRTGADIHVFLGDVDADDEKAGDRDRQDLIFKAVDWFSEDAVNGAVGDRSRYSWVPDFNPYMTPEG
ncbi:hypothetical protein IAT38_005259 [Cryptococcus sp. DSM 104549]